MHIAQRNEINNKALMQVNELELAVGGDISALACGLIHLARGAE